MIKLILYESTRSEEELGGSKLALRPQEFTICEK